MKFVGVWGALGRGKWSPKFSSAPGVSGFSGLPDLKPKTSALFVLLVFLFFSAFPIFPMGAVHAASQTVRKEIFLSQLLAARGFETQNNARGNAVAILKSGIVPEFVSDFEGSVTRREALRWMIQSLGLGTEAQILSNIDLSAVNLRFSDEKSLSPLEKGCLAVATLMTPPLFKKEATVFGPAHKIDPDEAKVLIANVRRASRNLKLEVRFTPASGMELAMYREGTFSGVPKWRVYVDGFDEKSEVDELRRFFASQGFKMEPSNPNYEWRLGSELMEDYARVRRLVALAKERGKSSRVFSSIKNLNLDNQPFYWALLTLDPSYYAMEPIIAPQGVTSLAPLSSMVRWSDASAAINAGFFAITGRNRGAPIGTLKIGRVLVNKPYQGRTCLGWTPNNRAAFGEVSWEGRAQLSEGWLAINSVNHYLKGNALVLYTQHYGRTTPPNGQAVEVLVEDGKCLAVNFSGETPLGPGRCVLAGYGTNAAILAERLSPGDPVRIDGSLNGGDPQWDGMDDIIQGGPSLIRDGKIEIASEGFSASIINLRHPRSVIGLTKQGHWAFFVGDGRDGMHSAGYTLQEVASILRRNNVTYALNLDGGGSTQMMVGDNVFNSPSDKRERPLSYGVGAKRRASRS
ncbi:MAG: phosphodiester glycosidase family protein [Synergistaceae bacterium]|nr:phosphodiester glycosidase family protein [Synergistaceae bacterium]